MPKTDSLQGSLDLLVLKILSRRPRLHGYAIMTAIKDWSGDVLRAEEGSLYPALHRMERRGWIDARWGPSETNRKAKYYRLTAAGGTQLKVAARNWDRVVEAIAGVMGTRPAEA